MAMLQLYLLNLYCSPQCALLQVSLKCNLSLICPPPPRLCMCAVLAQLQRKKGLTEILLMLPNVMARPILNIQG